MKAFITTILLLLTLLKPSLSLGYVSYVLCPRLQSPGNGRVTITGLTFGSAAVYTCFNGYIIEPGQSRIRRCLQIGVWSGVAPACRSLIVCPSLSPPSNGDVTINRRSPGGIARYSCNNGFKLVPITSSSRTCQRNGQWSGEEPNCESIRANCGDPGTPANGRRVLNGTLEGNIVRYSCLINFELEGDQQRTCQSNGLWSGQLPICKQIIDCGALSSPSNGQVVVTGTRAGSKARYSCNNGFILSGGQSVRVCQANGVWSGNQPSCEPKGCGQLSNPQNGFVRVGSTTQGSIATYFCRNGFELIGKRQRVCQIGGQWSGQEPICQRKDRSCSVLTNPINGVVRITGGTFPGSIAIYKCQIGFQLIGNQKRRCQKNGVWSGREPFCRYSQAIACRQLSNPVNGLVQFSSTVPFSVALYTCRENFILARGNRRRVCQANGVWSGVMPQCLRRRPFPPFFPPLGPGGTSCPSPPSPLNGRVTISRDTNNLIATYDCNRRFRLRGNRIRYCQIDGSYSGNMPRCIRRIREGSRSFTRSFTGSSFRPFPPLRSGNRPPFRPFPPTRSRSRSGNRPPFRPPLPPVIGGTCPHLSPPKNGIVKVTGFEQGDTATYSCQNDYQLAGGSPTRTCTSRGTWSHLEPKCVSNEYANHLYDNDANTQY